MKSELSRDEFKRRLSELTAEEKGFYFITPYDFSGKPFCGEYDDTTFELSKNSFWAHVVAMRIKGEYKGLDNKSTEVVYEVGWTKLTRNLTLVFGCIAIFGMNTAVILNRSSFSSSFFSVLLTINGFIAFSCFFGVVINWLTKKIVNQKFKAEFEIGVRDEWSSHTDSLIYKRLIKP